MRGTTPSTGGMPSCSHPMSSPHTMSPLATRHLSLTPADPSCGTQPALWYSSQRAVLCRAMPKLIDQQDPAARSDKKVAGSSSGPSSALARARAMLRGSRSTTTVDKADANTTAVKGLPASLVKKDASSTAVSGKAGAVRSASPLSTLTASAAETASGSAAHRAARSRVTSAASVPPSAAAMDPVLSSKGKPKAVKTPRAKGNMVGSFPAATQNVVRVSYSDKARVLLDLALRMGPEADGESVSLSGGNELDDLPSLHSILSIGRGGTAGGTANGTAGGMYVGVYGRTAESIGWASCRTQGAALHASLVESDLGGVSYGSGGIAIDAVPPGIGLHTSLAADHMLVPGLADARQSLEALLLPASSDDAVDATDRYVGYGADDGDDLLPSDGFPEDALLTAALRAAPYSDDDSIGCATMRNSSGSGLLDDAGPLDAFGHSSQLGVHTSSRSSTPPTVQGNMPATTSAAAAATCMGHSTATAIASGTLAQQTAAPGATKRALPAAAVPLELNDIVIDDLVSNVKLSATGGTFSKRTRANSKALATAAVAVAATAVAAAAVASSSVAGPSSSSSRTSSSSSTGTALAVPAITRKRSKAKQIAALGEEPEDTAGDVEHEVEEVEEVEQELEAAVVEGASDPAPTVWPKSARFSKIDPAVLAKLLTRHALPPEVAAGLTEAVQRGQLPLNEATMARTLDRLLGDKQLDQALVLCVLRKLPAVLKQTNVILRAKHARLVHLLDCDKEVVNKMLSNVPSLWGLKIETLRLKVDSLQKLLQLPRREVLLLVRKCPGLLASDSNTLCEKFKALMCLVAQPQRDVVNMVVQAPTLLFLNSDNLAIKFRTFAEAMGVSMEDLGNMAVVKPQLITSSTETVLASWTLVAAAAAKSARWTKELQALSPGTRSGIALSGRLKLRRLAYLVDTNQPEASSLSHTLGMTQANFIKRFPEFRAWSRLQAATA